MQEVVERILMVRQSDIASKSAKGTVGNLETFCQSADSFEQSRNVQRAIVTAYWVRSYYWGPTLKLCKHPQCKPQVPHKSWRTHQSPTSTFLQGSQLVFDSQMLRWTSFAHPHHRRIRLLLQIMTAVAEQHLSQGRNPAPTPCARSKERGSSASAVIQQGTTTELCLLCLRLTHIALFSISMLADSRLIAAAISLAPTRKISPSPGVKRVPPSCATIIAKGLSPPGDISADKSPALSPLPMGWRTPPSRPATHNSSAAHALRTTNSKLLADNTWVQSILVRTYLPGKEILTVVSAANWQHHEC